MAAAATVVHHTELSHTIMGSSGVDLFFIISGFIMALVCRRETRPLTFITLRFWRIYPLWWLVTVVAVLLGASDAAGAPWGSIAVSLLLWPSELPIVFQGWTLQIEVFFYAIIAIGLAMAPRSLLRFVSICLCILAAIGLVVTPEGRVAYTYTQTVLLEFVAGIALERLWLRRILPSTCQSLVLIAVVALALGAQLRLPYGGDHLRVLLWGVPYAMLLWAALGLEAAGRVPHWPVLLLLGDASYSLYLSHKLIMPSFRPWAWALPGPVVILMMLAASELLSIVLYRGVERPLLRFGHAVAGRQRATATGVARAVQH